MIMDRDTDNSQGLREGIGARGVTGLILALEWPETPLTLLRQPNRSLDFANVVT